jgi:hypothetical protein
MVGDFEDVGGVDAVCMAEAGNALYHRGSGDSAMEEKVENAGVDRNSVVFGSIA